ncbi:MAG TPA: crotonase/enoyl-CoA hydratase family protein [Spongiibacteraceae bacterium]
MSIPITASKNYCSLEEKTVFQRIRIEIDAIGIAHVQLIRTEKRNALDYLGFTELAEAAAQLRDNSRVRAVVMSGEGAAFCAGIDITLFADPTDVHSLLQAPLDESGANAAQRVAWAWHMLPVPVIAAVHGIAFGAGLQLMSAADIRYVHPDTKLSIMEIEYGLVPDMAGTQLWKTLVRADVVRELTYTARNFNGIEAQTLGFATQVTDDPLAMAMQTARAIAGKNPHAIRAAKRIFNAQAADSVADGLRREGSEQLALLFSPNQREAVAAKLQKRAPQFIDPTE